jgi:hypothetical protein
MADQIDDWKKKQKDYLNVAIICFIIGTYFFMKVISGSYIIKPSDLQTYENLITEKAPELKETKGKHRRRWIEFKCVNNQSTFKIASFDYRCANRNDVLTEIKAGDTIAIALLKSDIADFDKETSCEIHSLIKNNNEYLNIACRNRADSKDGKRGFILLFAISIMTAILYSLSQKPKFFDHVHQDFIMVIILIILFFILL